MIETPLRKIDCHAHLLGDGSSVQKTLLHDDFRLAAIDTLYRCHDRLLDHRDALCNHLKERRTWIMDRGIPTEVTLGQMRAADPSVRYLVGTPKDRLTKLEKDLASKDWQ
ncbi:MAG: hypothetical protein ACO3JG_13895 [Luteolibacter sp.]